MIRDKYPENFYIYVHIRLFCAISNTPSINNLSIQRDIIILPKKKNYIELEGLDSYTYVNNVVKLQIDICNSSINIYNDNVDNTYDIKDLDDDPELYEYIVPYIYDAYKNVFNKVKNVSNDFEEFLCALYIEYTITKDIHNFIECYGEKILEYIYNKY